MVPIRLKVGGFLTFRDPQEVNFEELYDDGIFLISGPTGSGKTSLFDAISFALYGETPTTGRERARELRSHLIPANGIMEVEYEFMAGGRTYLVRRWQKGEGKAVSQRLVVDGDEENALTKISDIKDAVTDVLGLSADQFSKIVMLPQGEFQNFLTASSKDKSEILRKLFDTDHYARIRNLIKEKLVVILGKVNQAETVLDQEKRVSEKARQLLDPREIQETMETQYKDATTAKGELGNRLTFLRKEHQLQELRLQQAEKLNEELNNKEELKLLLAEDLKLEAKYKVDEELANQLNRIRPLSGSHDRLVRDGDSLARSRDKLAEYRRVLKEQEIAFADAERDKEKNPQRQDEIARLSSRITRIQETMGELKQLIELKSKEEEIQKALGRLSEKLQRSEKIQTEISILGKKAEEASQREIQLINNINEAKDQEREKQDQLNALKKLEELEAKWAGNRNEEVTAGKNLEESSHQQGVALKAYQDQKAAFERQGLAQFTHLIQEGEPCPLCGSEHHPSVYRMESAIPSENVQKQLQEVNAKQRRVTQLENDLQHLKETKVELEDSLKAFGEEHAALDLTLDRELLNLDRKELEQGIRKKTKELEICREEGRTSRADKRELEAEGKELEGVKTLHEEKKKELIIIGSKISDLADKAGHEDENSLTKEKAGAENVQITLRREIKTAETSFQKLSNEVIGLKTSIIKTEEDIERLTGEVTEQQALFQESLGKLSLSREEFLRLQKDLDQEEALRKEASKFFSRIKDRNTRLQIMEENLVGQTPQHLDAFKKMIEELSKAIKDTKQEEEAAIRWETSLESALKRIRQAVRELELHSIELETARKLDQTTGKGTTFENYVLGYYLDGVLSNATSRLNHMTAGRFSLVRQSKDSGDRRTIEGLDINVFDIYSNTERDVKTLSGGESFKASLSMALGLSDFIQETKTGIRLETIFIDEGFGTLDQESLDSAMETILDIKGQGRLVGIISHVEELKERIPSQLIVENNGAAGSTVRIRKLG